MDSRSNLGSPWGIGEVPGEEILGVLVEVMEVFEELKQSLMSLQES